MEIFEAQLGGMNGFSAYGCLRLAGLAAHFLLETVVVAGEALGLSYAVHTLLGVAGLHGGGSLTAAGLPSAFVLHLPFEAVEVIHHSAHVG